MTTTADLETAARKIRRLVLDMAAGPEGAHVGGSLSAAEILAVLYNSVLRVDPRDPEWAGRDYFILSKGHSAAALYAALAQRGFISECELSTYAQEGSRLAGHPLAKLPGIEFPTGSLGHGLSLGVGLAIASQRDCRANRVFTLLGDGELQEGSVWEAALSASRFALDNLTAIVDRNKLQISGTPEYWLDEDTLAQRWESFGWSVVNCDGHKIPELLRTLNSTPFKKNAPSIVIANTKKAKGVVFMEGQKKSHYVKLTKKLYDRALQELTSERRDGRN